MTHMQKRVRISGKTGAKDMCTKKTILISSLKTEISKLEICIFSLKIYISSLEIKKTSSHPPVFAKFL